VRIGRIGDTGNLPFPPFSRFFFIHSLLSFLVGAPPASEVDIVSDVTLLLVGGLSVSLCFQRVSSLFRANPNLFPDSFPPITFHFLSFLSKSFLVHLSVEAPQPHNPDFSRECFFGMYRRIFPVTPFLTDLGPFNPLTSLFP